MEAASVLANSHSLELMEVSEPETNSLRVVVRETRPEPASAGDTEGPIPGAVPVCHLPDCHVFELVWDSYIAYSIRNESYARSVVTEQYSGRLLRLYSRSCFLDYVAAGTFASQGFPGAFQHYGLVCHDHVLDVVSVDAPRIQIAA